MICEEPETIAIVTKQNTYYLNALRIIATYLVILLHCIAPFLTQTSLFGTKTWWACNIMSSFVRMGVPLFFMISGYLLLTDSRTLSIKEFYKRRLIKILIPFLTWDIIYFVIKSLDSGKNIDIRVFFAELFKQGSSYHLWFVYAMLGIYLLSPFLKRIVNTCTGKQLLWFMVVILLPVTIFRFINVVFSADVLLFKPLVEGYVGFFLFGYLLGQYSQTRRQRAVFYCGGLIGLLIGVFGNYLLSSSDCIHVVFNEGYSITHYLTSGAFFVFMKALMTKRSSYEGLYTAYSNITYGIYLSHVVFLNYLFKNLLSYMTPIIQIFCGFALTSLCATITMLVFSRIPMFRKRLM